jgi:hypothetical protein
VNRSESITRIFLFLLFVYKTTKIFSPFSLRDVDYYKESRLYPTEPAGGFLSSRQKKKKKKKLELGPKREYIDSQDHWLLGLTTGGTDDTVNKVYVHQDGRKRRGTAFNPLPPYGYNNAGLFRQFDTALENPFGNQLGLFGLLRMFGWTNLVMV